MNHNSPLLSTVLLALLAIKASTFAMAQETAVPAAPVSKAQAAIQQAGEEGKYAFLVFHKASDAPLNAMTATLKAGLAGKSDQATVVYVQVGNPGEQSLVAKYDVARAPLPLIVALAPNGAMTGVFSQKVTAEKIGEAFVTPTMMFAMKNLQAGKLVLVTVHGSAKVAAPAAIKDFQNDPHFKDRFVTTTLNAADPVEAKFVGQMQIDPNAKATHTVLLAPPGVMVGKFDATAPKDQIAAALAKAGKCCDDPNCKHHQPARTTTQPPQGVKR